METTDLFRCRIDAMINLRHPLAVLAMRLPWSAIEAYLAPKFERKERPGQLIEGHDVLAQAPHWWASAQPIAETAPNLPTAA